MIWFDDKGVGGDSRVVVMCVCMCDVCATFMNNEVIFYCFIFSLNNTQNTIFFSHSQSYRFFQVCGLAYIDTMCCALEFNHCFRTHSPSIAGPCIFSISHHSGPCPSLLALPIWLIFLICPRVSLHCH